MKLGDFLVGAILPVTIVGGGVATFVLLSRRHLKSSYWDGPRVAVKPGKTYRTAVKVAEPRAEGNASVVVSYPDGFPGDGKTASAEVTSASAVLDLPTVYQIKIRTPTSPGIAFDVDVEGLPTGNVKGETHTLQLLTSNVVPK